MGGRLIWTSRRGAQSPSGKGLKGGGDTPPSPLFFEGSNGVDGKARDPEYKRWDRSRLRLSAIGLCSKMADSLPVVPDDLPVLPDEVYEIIAREYRLATAKDRALDGWYRIHGEMRYLPRCPKRKRIISLKGFSVPRHGNLLRPVTGYFFRRMMRTVFGRDGDARFYRWFRRVFGESDYLRPDQAVEWPFVYCHYCGEGHECGDEEAEEEREYQREQRAYRKKIRRVANVWAQRDWQTRLRPRRPKT